MALVGIEHNLEESTAPTYTAVHPVALADVKDFANVDADDHDDDHKIIRAIEAACIREQEALSIQIPQATYKLHLDSFPDEIELRRPPVSSVSSITYLDTNGTQQTLATSVYRVTNTDVRGRPGLVTLDYNQDWPDTRGVSRDVTVTFVCGYAANTVPRDMQMLIAACAAEDVYGCGGLSMLIESYRARLRWTV